MSELVANQITGRSQTPTFSEGLVVTGVTTGINVTGVGTVAQFNCTDVVSTAATFTTVTIGGTLTYEDVTNIDSVGIITARSGVKVNTLGVDIAAGGLKVIGVSTFGNSDITIDGSASGVTSVTWDASADSLIFKDNSKAIFGDDSDLQIYYDGSNSYIKHIKSSSDVYFQATRDIYLQPKAAENGIAIKADGATELFYDNSKKIETTTAGAKITGIATATGKIVAEDGIDLSSGTTLLREQISQTATAWSATNTLNLDNGMVQYTSGNLGGTNNTLNIISSVGINTQMNTGDMICVTGITSVNATTAYVNALQIDYNTVQVAWVGGSAPSDGGNSGFDTYTFNIWKTASATYNVIGNQVKTS